MFKGNVDPLLSLTSVPDAPGRQFQAQAQSAEAYLGGKGNGLLVFSSLREAGQQEADSRLGAFLAQEFETRLELAGVEHVALDVLQAQTC